MNPAIGVSYAPYCAPVEGSTGANSTMDVFSTQERQAETSRGYAEAIAIAVTNVANPVFRLDMAERDC